MGPNSYSNICDSFINQILHIDLLGRPPYMFRFYYEFGDFIDLLAVAFLQVFAAPYSLRFPRIDRVRYDKPWHECLDVQCKRIQFIPNAS